jgi:hypothetical protein
MEAAEHAPADAQDHWTVPSQDHPEGSLVTVGKKGIKQLGVCG